jgi:hypothetical protein
MDEFGLALVVASTLGMLAILLILRRERQEVDALAGESPFALSTEGETICPKCGMGSLWTDTTCIGCGKPLAR